MNTVYPFFDARRAEFLDLLHAWQHRLHIPRLSPACRKVNQIFGELEEALEAVEEMTHADPEFGSKEWFEQIPEEPF